MALAQACYALGDILWGLVELGFHRKSFPSVADAAYLAFYPLFLVGVLLLPQTPVRPRYRIRMVVDMGIVMLAALLSSWNLLLGPTIEGSESTL